MDVDTFPVGADFRKSIGTALSDCDIVLAIIGEKWHGFQESGSPRIFHTGDTVRVEIETAMADGLPVVPVLLGKTAMPSKDSLPDTLRDFAYRHGLRVDPGEDFQIHMERLIRRLNELPSVRPVVLSTQASTSAGIVGRLFRRFRMAVWVLLAVALVLVINHLAFVWRPSLEQRPSDRPQPPEQSRAGPTPTQVWKVAELQQRLSRIESVMGLYRSSETGVLVLLGRESDTPVEVPLTIEDIAFCLRTALSAVEETPTVSFDPIPSDPRSHQVRYLGGIENTHLGYVLFTADRALKEYTLGSRLNGTPVQSQVTVYPQMIAGLRDPQRRDLSGSLSGRYWLRAKPALAMGESQRVARVEDTGISLAYEAAQSPQQEARASQFNAFAESFTHHYTSFAEESPGLKAFVRLVQVMALARWLSQSVGASPPSWAERFACSEFSTPSQLPTIRTKLQEERRNHDSGTYTQIAEATISGGVMLPVRSDVNMASRSPGLAMLEIGISRAMSDPASRLVFGIEHGGETLSAVVLSIGGAQ